MTEKLSTNLFQLHNFIAGELSNEDLMYSTQTTWVSRDYMLQISFNISGKEAAGIPVFPQTLN